MAFLAFDMMAVIGRHANPQHKKTQRRTTAKTKRSHRFH
jgi:hypothetical protein